MFIKTTKQQVQGIEMIVAETVAVVGDDLRYGTSKLYSEIGAIVAAKTNLLKGDNTMKLICTRDEMQYLLGQAISRSADHRLNDTDDHDASDDIDAHTGDFVLTCVEGKWTRSWWPGMTTPVFATTINNKDLLIEIETRDLNSLLEGKPTLRLLKVA